MPRKLCEGAATSFTRAHKVKRLVWYERHETMLLAIQRKKTLKHWPRQWKIELVAAMNPEWGDLWDQVNP